MTEESWGEKEKQIQVCLMTEEEFSASDLQKKDRSFWELSYSFRHAAYCKTEVYTDQLFGILKIPDKKKTRGKPEVLGYHVSQGKVLFLDNGNRIKECLRKLRSLEKGRRLGECQLLLGVMNCLIEEDAVYLQRFEERITELEDLLLEGTPRELPRILMRLRKDVMKLHNFYVQLIDIGEEMQGNSCTLLDKKTEAAWRVFTSRVTRLHGYTETIRENLLQLHELYQAQVDIQQNEIMTVLTVVTTIFLPLSLLAGWYGMNFGNMPLIHWKYGYAAVILITLLIIALELRYFRKKGFLKKAEKKAKKRKEK